MIGNGFLSGFLRRAVLVGCAALTVALSAPGVARAQQVGSVVSLQSVNYPDSYVQTDNLRARIAVPSTGTDDAERSFYVRAGLAGSGISFESVSHPGHYLRHRNYEVWLDPFQDTQLFRADASFLAVTGLAGQGVSYRSVNYPDRYIRHQNYLLFVHPYENTSLFLNDASFVPLAANTQTGTVTPPVLQNGAGDDSCRWANDGECDDPTVPGHVSACAPGTDRTDCSQAGPGVQSGDNSCRWARDGDCDDPTVRGAVTGLCAPGTDTADCTGLRVPADISNICLFANDGECDDPTVPGHLTEACAPGTDQNDCRTTTK